MSNVYIALFNGTAINFPINLSQNEFLEMLGTAKEDCQKVSPKDVYDNLKEMEELLLQNSINGYVCESVIKKVAEIMGINEMSFVCMWFGFLHYLMSIKYEKVMDTERNSLIIMAKKDGTDKNFSEIMKTLSKGVKKEIKNKCGLKSCENKGVHSCGKCRMIYYCCKDCQREDWKRHKKECK